MFKSRLRVLNAAICLACFYHLNTSLDSLRLFGIKNTILFGSIQDRDNLFYLEKQELFYKHFTVCRVCSENLQSHQIQHSTVWKEQR